MMWLQRTLHTADRRSLAFNYGNAEERGVMDATYVKIRWEDVLIYLYSDAKKDFV